MSTLHRALDDGPRPIESGESLSPVFRASRQKWDERLVRPSDVARGRGEVLAAAVAGAALVFALLALGGLYALSRWWSSQSTSSSPTEMNAPRIPSKGSFGLPVGRGGDVVPGAVDEGVALPLPSDGSSSPEALDLQASEPSSSSADVEQSVAETPGLQPPEMQSIAPAPDDVAKDLTSAHSPDPDPPQTNGFADRLRIDPVTIGDVSIDPVSIDPVSIDPVTIDPVRIDPVKIDPVEIDPVKIDPVKIDPVKIDPVKIDPVKIDPVTVNH